MALLLAKPPTPEHLKQHTKISLPQFGLKFHGHVLITTRGYYTFQVTTSHPFRLAINGESLVEETQPGIYTQTMNFEKTGYFSIEANFFYYGQFDDLESSYGSDRPILNVKYALPSSGIFNQVRNLR